MTIQELFRKVCFEDVFNLVLKRHTIIYQPEFDCKNPVLLNNFKNAAASAYMQLLNRTATISTDTYMVVAVGVNEDNVKEEKWFSFLISRKELLEKKEQGPVNLWEEPNRLEHYGYQFLPWDKILGFQVSTKSLSLDNVSLAAEIFCEITRFGFNEENIQKLNNEISSELEDTEENVQDTILSARKRRCDDVNSFFSELCDKLGISRRPREYESAATERRYIVEQNHQKVLSFLPEF